MWKTQICWGKSISNSLKYILELSKKGAIYLI